MTKPRKRSTLTATAAVVLLFGCSTHHGSSGGSAPPNTPPADGAPLTDGTYGLDAAPMNQGKALAYDGKPVAWTVRAVIDGKETLNLAQKAFADVVAGFQTLKVTGASSVTLEFSLFGTGADGKPLLLATNLAASAATSPATKGIWDSQCSAVTTTFVVLDQVAANGNLSVNLKLCDFADLLVAPVVSITPANESAVDLRNIVYSCTMPSHAADDYLFDVTVAPTCHIGYTALPAGALTTPGFLQNVDGTAKVFTYPATASLSEFTLDNTNEWYLRANGAAPFVYRLSDMPNYTGLPVDGIGDCYGLEIQHFFKDAATVSTGAPAKEFRLTWTRTMDTSGNWSWSPANQGQMPAAGQAESGDFSNINFYLFCTWQNQTGAAVGTIGLTAG